MSSITCAPSAASVVPSVEAIVTEKAMRAERVVAVARIVLAAITGVRSYWIWSRSGWSRNAGRALVAYPTMAAAILFSLVFLLGVWKPRRVERFLYLSVTADTLFCLA